MTHTLSLPGAPVATRNVAECSNGDDDERTATKE